MEGITYNEYCEQIGVTLQCVRMRIIRAAEKGLLTNSSVDKDAQIPNEVLSFLTGGAAVSNISPAQKQDVSKRPKAAKQATIPMPVNNSDFTAEQTPVKSIFDRLNSVQFNSFEVYGIMVVICVVLSYGLISTYGVMGVGLSMLYALYSLYVVRLSRQEKTITSAEHALTFFIIVEVACIYVHATMYYNEIVNSKSLMIDVSNKFAVILTSCIFGAFTSAIAIVALTSSIRVTRERAEYDYQNAPLTN
jgi:hypothetical protein